VRFEGEKPLHIARRDRRQVDARSLRRLRTLDDHELLLAWKEFDRLAGGDDK
jgi:hypothetical protein